MSNILYILIGFLFVFLNGFFVAAEFAIVKIRDTQVLTLENKGIHGRILAKIHRHLDAYLSACQLGITLASLGLGWIGEPAFAHILIPLFTLLGIESEQTITVLSIMVAFGIISYLHIVLGELMPKSLSIRKTQIMALWTAIPLYVFYWIMYPAIWFLNISSNFFLGLCGLDTPSESVPYSTEEINLILKASHLHGEFSKLEVDFLTRCLQFTDLQVLDVMRPIGEMIALDINHPIQHNLQQISEKRYSRYPIYKKEVDNILGIVHIKDLFSAIPQPEKPNLKDLMRPIVKVKQEMAVFDLFHKFRQGKSHFAIVYSGKIAIGFVTLDNLLQAIIGKIRDEFHFTSEDWITLDDGSFIIKGSASLFVLEQLLDVKAPDLKANTVSGLILHSLESFPKEKQVIEFEDFTVKVLKTAGPKIVQVHVYKKVRTDQDNT